MRIRSLACAATALGFLSACTGGAMQAIPPGSASPSAQSAHRDRAELQVRLKIPRRHHHRRGGRYVSPSTQSISIAEGTKTLGTFDTTASSGKCTLNDGGTVCTFKMGILTGKNQTFTVNTFDQAGGAGNKLSTGSVTKTIVAGLNVIPITLDGVVASIAVALNNPNPTAGTKLTTGVVVMANDADGNTIIGPGTYSSAITLTDSDTSGVTSLSATTVNGPNDGITLSYSGGNITQATIGASASGVLSTNITGATFQPVPTGIADFQLPSAIGTNAGVPLGPIAIANGGDGNLWFSAQTNSGSPANAIIKMTTAGAMTTFVPGTAPSSNLPDDQINGLALGSDGNVWYAAVHNIGKITPAGAVTNIAISTISGFCASGAGERIVPAADGGLWVMVDCGSAAGQVYHVPVTATTGANVTLNTLPANDRNLRAAVVGKDGKLYVAGYDNGAGQPALFQASITGGNTINGTPTVLDFPALGTGGLVGIAQTPNGDLWTTNYSCSVSAFARVNLAAGFNAGNTTTFNTLAGCGITAFLTALPDGSLWIPEEAYAEALQVIPSANEGTPFQYALSLPVPQNLYANMYDSVLGPDGFVYMTDNSGGLSSASANVVKVAY